MQAKTLALQFLSFVALFRHVTGQEVFRVFQFEDLKPCELTTTEISNLGPNDPPDPCILYDVKPSGVPVGPNSTSVIPLVQVTPANCASHRDGAVTGVEKINEDNNNRGVAVGFQRDHFVQFTLTSVVAGNPVALSEGEYDQRHEQLLRSMLQVLDAKYIVGTCSFASSIEKQVAGDFEAIVMAQVGPPGFYTPENSNPYVFGIHINSDTYPLPNVQSLDFLAQEQEVGGRSSIPVRVLYRTKSEFFYSTCQSAIDRLRSEGFTDLQAILYDHSADADNDGEINQLDVDFLEGLADELCPPEQSQAGDFHPAIFMCTLTEQQTILERLAATGCRPTSLWLTAATWGWAGANSGLVPYFQGGGQWHEKFDYSDDYFESGLDLLLENKDRFGYMGNYDQVVSYAIPVLFAQHLVSAYRVTDVPNPSADFATPEGRERLRRAMLILNVDTLFGPVSFNDNQRNIGRGAAGTQWLPVSADGAFSNALVSPFLQAEASTVIPAESAIACDAGSFANNTVRLVGGSILSSGCTQCPVDSFTVKPSFAPECAACPEGSGTNEEEGSDKCFIFNDNLLSSGLIAFGYTAVFITWALAIVFLIWLYLYRNDPVVKVSQIEFMVLICVGAMISSSTVLALSSQAGSNEDTGKASAGCAAAPFLYAIGWVLQYSSLSAKTYRLFQTMMNTKKMKRSAVTAAHMVPVVVVCLVVDLIIVIWWTASSPLQYERTEDNRDVDEENGIITINSVGRCVSSGDDFWRFAAPLLCFHVVLMIGTNLLLYFVRDIGDRYQEQKYVAYASGLMLEILVVGVPVMVSVNDSAEATFIVLTAIIALDDIAVLSFVFGPKIMFQRKGLEAGVQFGESIMRESHRRASQREFSRRAISEASHSFSQANISHSEMSPDRSNASTAENEMPSVTKRRDSFTNRVTGGKRPLLGESTVESILEETSDDIVNELGDNSGNSSQEVQSVTKSQEKTPGAESSSMMMTPAGMVAPSAYAQNFSSGSVSATTDESSQEALRQSLTSQQKMLELAQNMMAEQAKMMKATAEMMVEHNRLKDELLEAKGNNSALIDVESERSVPRTIEGTTEQNSEKPVIGDPSGVSGATIGTVEERSDSSNENENGAVKVETSV